MLLFLQVIVFHSVVSNPRCVSPKSFLESRSVFVLLQWNFLWIFQRQGLLRAKFIVWFSLRLWIRGPKLIDPGPSLRNNRNMFPRFGPTRSVGPLRALCSILKSPTFSFSHYVPIKLVNFCPNFLANKVPPFTIFFSRSISLFESTNEDAGESIKVSHSIKLTNKR